MPECSVHLTHATIYLSLAPKSNAADAAYLSAKADAAQMLSEPVPLHLRNAPTQLMKNLDYGKGYKYAHDYDSALTDMHCLPQSLAGRRYYIPTGQGRELRVSARMEEIESWRRDQNK